MKEDGDGDVVGEEVNEEVVGILQEAYGKGMERVNLSGRQLKLLPEAFGRIPGLLLLDLSANQLSVTTTSTHSFLFNPFPNTLIILTILFITQHHQSIIFSFHKFIN